MLRQQYTFRPPGTTREGEDYTVALDGVTHVVLRIVPDITGGEARATLAAFRLLSCLASQTTPARDAQPARSAMRLGCRVRMGRASDSVHVHTCIMPDDHGWGMLQGDRIAIFCLDVDQQRREELIHGQRVVDTQRAPEPDVHRLHRHKAQAP
ncbi:MAG TPA: hypothetical protein VI542_29880 [Candidatus Tectomicrobia bacterium]